jgi:VWFA-related protein
VSEDGRAVEVSYFEAIEAGVVDAHSQESWDGATVGEPAAIRARRIVLLVDTVLMTHGQLLRARESAARYLRESTSEGDWVRLVDLSSGRVRDGWMPEDRVRLELAARTLVRGGVSWGDRGGEGAPIVDRVDRPAREGQPSETWTSGQFLSIFSQTSGLLGHLETLLTELRGLDGRKAVVLISPGFPQLRDLDRTLEQVATLAREAAAAVYFVDVTGFDAVMPQPGEKLKPVFETAWERSGGSQDLAEATGGFTFRFGNSLAPALARIGGEMRTYYVLGYLPRRPDDGRFRSVKVKVDVPGVTARTKKGYLAGSPR